jgi:DNA repair protein RadC
MMCSPGGCRRPPSLIEVRVLDHIVVGGVETVSFAERGLL